MANPSREPRLVEEHRYELRVLRVLRVEALDGHGAREPYRAAQAAVVDGRHPSRRNGIKDRIATEHARRLG